MISADQDDHRPGDIAARLAEVQGRISSAARQAGRAEGEVRLIAVSKGKPEEAIRAAYAAGQRDFGENYAQELAEKAARLSDLPGIVWHAIGQLQRNKAKVVAQVADVVHAVDRVELVTELDRRAAAGGRVLRVLVEVNVGGEATKGGCTPEGVEAVLGAAQRCAHLRSVGLMAIAPYLEDPAAVRPYFAALRALRDRHGGAEVLPELSMGMSHDFEGAIAEGATWVRVGTAIFGSRSQGAQ
ncbi:YggS family pyridoxal phosphate-dependent enzyme [Chondromyces apiculatus]|uniref:Pyridoxal phosphate homeostasis protein n=1 Tax=Chondromyces apiculatus DSM 436 TaxID=1192034 RepID=A0A017T2V8_9BACT|nr:YggS family pyridoxal phosphate-dependent enzyme [Chondromyces apiculatus]EYF03564.1 putative proline synthase [Chondromyces apiculatus DSM 436]